MNYSQTPGGHLESGHVTTMNSSYQPFEEPGRCDSYYLRYLELSKKVASKYPDPGPPMERCGRAGSSWRHIKQVLGHSGAHHCFVDGLVRLQDQDAANRVPPRPRTSFSPPYAPCRGDVIRYTRAFQDDNCRTGSQATSGYNINGNMWNSYLGTDGSATHPSARY